MNGINAKVGIGLGIAFTVMWIGFMAMRESPDEKYERFEQKGKPAASGTIPAAKPDFEASDSYQFKFSAVGLTLPGDMHDAFLAAIRKAISPSGLNPAQGPKAGGGDLGTITVGVTVETQAFRGMQQRIQHHSGDVPYKLTGTLTVENAATPTSWDGTHEISATVPLPDEIREGILYDTIARQCRDLARQAVDSFKKSKPFTR